MCRVRTRLGQPSVYEVPCSEHPREEEPSLWTGGEDLQFYLPKCQQVRLMALSFLFLSLVGQVRNGSWAWGHIGAGHILTSGR